MSYLGSTVMNWPPAPLALYAPRNGLPDRPPGHTGASHTHHITPYPHRSGCPNCRHVGGLISWNGVMMLVVYLHQSLGTTCLPFQLPSRSISRPRRAISRVDRYIAYSGWTDAGIVEIFFCRARSKSCIWMGRARSDSSAS